MISISSRISRIRRARHVDLSKRVGAGQLVRLDPRVGDPALEVLPRQPGNLSDHDIDADHGCSLMPFLGSIGFFGFQLRRNSSNASSGAPSTTFSLA